MNVFKGAAVAAALAVASIGSTAAAAETFTMVSASMNTNYIAAITGEGRAYSNGVTFTVSGYDYPVANATTSLFGFCIDIYHNMYLGVLAPYGITTYSSNQDTGGGLVPNTPQVLTNSGGANPLDPLNQISAITNLVDTGWLLHQQDANGNALKTAAIQAAIWAIESPGNVTVENGGATLGLDTKTFQQYFDDYRTGNYLSLADANDKVFTISDGAHQSFAIGWPITGVPEPMTWVMMLLGFFGMGAALRGQRKAGSVAAI